MWNLTNAIIGQKMCTFSSGDFINAISVHVWLKAACYYHLLFLMIVSAYIYCVWNVLLWQQVIIEIIMYSLSRWYILHYFPFNYPVEATNYSNQSINYPIGTTNYPL